MYPFKREAEGALTHTGEGHTETEQRLEDTGLGGQVPCPPEPTPPQPAPPEAARGLSQMPQSPGGVGPTHTLVSVQPHGHGRHGGLFQPPPDSNTAPCPIHEYGLCTQHLYALITVCELVSRE